MSSLNLNFDEKLAAVKEKVRATSDYQNFSDSMFIRFLRGQKEVVDNTVKAMVDTAEFRKESNADNLTVQDCQKYYDKRVTFVSGFDKESRPVINSLVHRHPAQDRDINEVKNFIIYVIDQALKMSKPEEEKVAIIFDLTQFSMKIMDFEAVKVFVTILQSHYPEILGQAYIVNAPFIFRACWTIIRPWLDPVTAAKVQFIRADQLTNFVDYDQIDEEVRMSCKLKQPSGYSEKARSDTITVAPEVLTQDMADMVIADPVKNDESTGSIDTTDNPVAVEAFTVSVDVEQVVEEA